MPHVPQTTDPSDSERAIKRSFSKWLATEPDGEVYSHTFEGLDQAIEDHGGRTVDGNGPLYPGLDLLIICAFKNLMQGIEEPYGVCESPIERMMLSALLVVAEVRDYSTEIVVNSSSCYKPGQNSLDHLVIKPQETLGNYRVDFLLSQSSWMPDVSNPRTLPNGETVPGTLEIAKQLIVECDGHDYHERTKEQASRDRARDRALQSVGYPVYRYTGSDIWKGVFRCAGEAITYLNTLVYPPIKRPKDA